MKNLFVLILLIAVLTGCTEKSEKTAVLTVDDREKLTTLKEVLWPKAYREQDTVLLDQILADEFQLIDSDGNWSDKKFELDYIKKNKPSYDSFRFEIKRLDIFENGTAVVAGTGHIEGEDENGPYKMIYQSSNILIKRQGEWKAIASHVSGIKAVNHAE
ncbi:MAG: nuclear transport factor 2 family protein [Cyclobacteriaceae bacterium]|nr:nuclear transport factor 2 family protein [Cyclobacteriaceae bacterium]